ncbi:MAG TPA: zinc ribbon domain-containing protein [Nitrososphaerales archaeon]|nr:zinc ribbon domain-containing protein [Nitrososphaerales archaeon]
METTTTSYCSGCGTQLETGFSYCPKCGAPVAGSKPSSYSSTQASPPTNWREERRREREQRREARYTSGGPGLGALVLATILIVAGLGIFFPQLPWEVFWGSLLILLGVWIVGARYLRRHGTTHPQLETAPR